MARQPKYGPGDDLAMMQEPDEWPLIEVLPLKNPRQKEDGTWPKEGLLFCPLGLSTVKPVIYLTNLFMLGGDRKLSEVETTTYDSFDAIIADGWIVD